MNLKRFFLMMICVCLTQLCVTSCANMSTYSKRLYSEEYRVSVQDEEGIKFSLRIFFGSEDDLALYEIEECIIGNFDYSSDRVFIFKHKSSKAAKRMADDLCTKITEIAKISYGDYEVQRRGNFVLFGTERAIEDAL